MAVGFTPLHFETLLAAHLQQALPGRAVKSRTGLFGDLGGTLAALADGGAEAAAIAIEWEDLDPRLGIRQLGSWSPSALPDILATVSRRLEIWMAAIHRIPSEVSIALALPSLPLPPVAHTMAPQWSGFELELNLILLQWAQGLAGRVRLVRPGALPSAVASRRDVKSALNTGFPYTFAFASELAAQLAVLIQPPSPRKGLITDLDDTFWLGIVGEVGASDVHWDLNHHAQIHGLYQQTLAALAEQGILLAVASKNSLDTVKQAFERTDLRVSPDKFFPLEVHWNAKSGSVRRILEKWNIGADAVTFIDDSPMEVADVQAAFPQMQCIVFPKDDPKAALELLYSLRNSFAKERVLAEDAMRLASIRVNAERAELAAASADAPEELLRDASSRLTFQWQDAEPRVLELVNKTNQFNLNGRRHPEPDWKARYQQQESFVASVAYEDRFGALGKIAVFAGQQRNGEIHLDTWVLSCRAFSRRIEHQCLATMFERFGARQISLDFAPTAKNGPTQELLATLSIPVDSPGQVKLGREEFLKLCPQLYHQVQSS